MFPYRTVILVSALMLAACSANQPRIIQATSDMPSIHLRGGMATQIELPDNGRVQSVTVGNPNLLTADKADNVVNLLPKEGASGETNVILRENDDGGSAKLYQYRVIVGN